MESTFSRCGPEARVTKGPGNKDAGLAMVFKLLEAAESPWWAVDGLSGRAGACGGEVQEGQAGRATQGDAKEDIDEVAT
jgi:hypothetical protein